jgi:glutamate--cysteine ligase
LLYDEQAMQRAEALIAPLSAEVVLRVRPEVATAGLRARLLDRPVGAWAADMLAIARAGLERIDLRNERGQNEAVYLEGLEHLVSAGHCPGDVLRAQLQGVTDPREFRERVLELTRV